MPDDPACFLSLTISSQSGALLRISPADSYFNPILPLKCWMTP
jgi:hypothetical protein